MQVAETVCPQLVQRWGRQWSHFWRCRSHLAEKRQLQVRSAFKYIWKVSQLSHLWACLKDSFNVLYQVLYVGLWMVLGKLWKSKSGLWVPSVDCATLEGPWRCRWSLANHTKTRNAVGYKCVQVQNRRAALATALLSAGQDTLDVSTLLASVGVACFEWVWMDIQWDLQCAQSQLPHLHGM